MGSPPAAATKTFDGVAGYFLWKYNRMLLLKPVPNRGLRVAGAATSNRYHSIPSVADRVLLAITTGDLLMDGTGKRSRS